MSGWKICLFGLLALSVFSSASADTFTYLDEDGKTVTLAAKLVGDGALRYRHELATLGGQVEFASASLAYPQAASLVELSIPRLEREEFDRVYDVLPLYLRKSDAEIAWDKRARAG